MDPAHQDRIGKSKMKKHILFLLLTVNLPMLTRAGYLWEFEIKINQQDWNRDNRKDQASGPAFWQRPTRDFSGVKRFYYVYKEGLVCPDWVPEWVGLMEARYKTLNGRCYIVLHKEREAKDRNVEKVKPEDREAMLRSIYHRFWKSQAEALT